MTAALVERDRSRAGAARRGSKSRPKLKVLNQQAIRQRARRRHALVALFIVVLLGFFAVAFVHAELVADQQQLDAIRTRIAEAEAHQAKVERAAEEASSPSAIVNRAQELGMVRANQPVFLAAAAPVRDVPAAISFRSSQTVTAVGVAAGDADTTTISVGISGTAPVRVAAASELATPAAGAGVAESAAGTETVVQTSPDVIAQPVQTPTVVGTTAAAGATASTGPVATPASATPVVATAEASTADAATPAPGTSDAGTSGASASTPAPAPVAATGTGGQSLGGTTVEQAPTSIAGTTAVVGGAGTPASGEEVGNSRFGGMSAGTGSG